MAVAYNPTVARVEVRGTLNDEQVMNVLWFRASVLSPNAADLRALITTVRDWWTGNIRQHIAPGYLLREVYGTIWSGPDGLVDALAVIPALAGTNPQPTLPGNAALVVTFRTGFRGRSGRGRNYVGGLSENDVSGNLWSENIVTNIVSGYEQLPTELQETPWEHVVYSQEVNGDTRPSGLANPVTAYTADRFVDSMRRRLAGRGR